MSYHVALFITCLTDQFYPRVGVAVTKILRQLGCRVDFPSQQTCCGQPFYNNGFHPQAADLARRMAALFEPYDYVVTPSASCCAMVRQHFPLLLKDDHAYRHAMEHLCACTFEFVEFLDQILHADVSHLRLAQRQKVTYHRTCHLRGLGVADASERLLMELGNVEFSPLEKTDQCCGFGGTFALKYPQISAAIVQDKIDCIRQSAAQTTICNDAGCTMNISGMCRRHGVSTPVQHIAEILAQAMGLDISGF